MENEKENIGNDLPYINKLVLGNHLADIIKECSDGMKKEQVNTQGWIWNASKKSLAESILIEFC